MIEESREYLCKNLDSTIKFLYELMDEYEKVHGIDFYNIDHPISLEYQEHRLLNIALQIYIGNHVKIGIFWIDPIRPISKSSYKKIFDIDSKFPREMTKLHYNKSCNVEVYRMYHLPQCYTKEDIKNITELLNMAIDILDNPKETEIEV